jgi:hypothetical protein
VYCPPVVPRGPVEAPEQRHKNAYVFGDKYSYGLSLQSESLADRNAAKKSNPDFPNFPSRPRGGDFTWNSFAAKFMVNRVRATVLTGDIASSGTAGWIPRGNLPSCKKHGRPRKGVAGRAFLRSGSDRRRVLRLCGRLLLGRGAARRAQQG